MWQLKGTEAHFESNRCRCVVDLSEVDCIRLTHLSVLFHGDDISLEHTWLLGLDTPGGTLEESYVRGDDLVAGFAENQQWPFRVQVYWRAVAEEDYFGFETIASVQTSRLDVSPELWLSTHFIRQPVKRHQTVQQDDRIALIQLPNTDVTYFEVAHSSNQVATLAVKNGMSHQLFNGHLEKGVIRRARIRGLFLPSTVADSLIPTLRNQFEQSAPPLTT